MKNSRRPKNTAEGKFHDMCISEGYYVTKRGWPDFIIQKDGIISFVEVKPRKGHRLKPNQEYVMNFLSNKGIDCFVYTPDGGLEKFEDYVKSLFPPN